VAGPLLPPRRDLDEEEIVPDSELEFEDLENAPRNESSGGSGDDFIPEENSQSDFSQNEDSDASFRLSKTTPKGHARPSSSKVGSSSKPRGGRRPTTKTQSDGDFSDSPDSSVAGAQAPQRKKAVPTKGKGRRNAAPPRRPRGSRRRGRERQSEKEESDKGSESSDGLLEPSDDDAKPPPKDLHPHQTLALIKSVQRRMRKKLGRKLTWV